MEPMEITLQIYLCLKNNQRNNKTIFIFKDNAVQCDIDNPLDACLQLLEGRKHGHPFTCTLQTELLLLKSLLTAEPLEIGLLSLEVVLYPTEEPPAVY
jgi:hypothetical protein